MKVACLILNYNDSETTIKLIENIINYNSIDYITVVDNKSTDGSLQRLKPYESDKVHVISSDKNGGYGYGNNFGIKYIHEKFQSKYILIANPDVYFTEHTVKALKKEFSNSSDCAIIAPTQLNKNKIVAWRLESTIKIVLSASLLLSKVFGNKLTKYNENYFLNKDKCYVDIISGSLLMVNTDIMLKYGMYDEEVFLYFEEIILAHKLIQNSYKSKILLNEVYEHEHSTSVKKSIKSIVATKKLLLNSEILFFTKYRGVRGRNLSQ